ncbi:unnamed protein product, partial [Iphiclides podalirius]
MSIDLGITTVVTLAAVKRPSMAVDRTPHHRIMKNHPEARNKTGLSLQLPLRPEDVAEINMEGVLLPPFLTR